MDTDLAVFADIISKGGSNMNPKSKNRLDQQSCRSSLFAKVITSQKGTSQEELH